VDIARMKEYIEIQFVDDYEHIKKFMEDVNNILMKMNIQHYDNYNKFCVEIEDYIIKIIQDYDLDESDLTIDVIIMALNDMIKQKILQDENFESKIKDFFDETEANNILKNIRQK
jgi:predicted secreted protein